MDIFVSYTLRDGVLNERELHRIYLALRGSGEPYVDVLHNRSSDRQAHVDDKLNHAGLLVACITPGFLDSEWVQYELAIATRRGIPIVALSIQPE